MNKPLPSMGAMLWDPGSDQHLSIIMFPGRELFAQLDKTYPNRIPREAILKLINDMDAAMLLNLPDPAWALNERQTEDLPKFFTRLREFRVLLVDFLKDATGSKFQIY